VVVFPDKAADLLSVVICVLRCRPHAPPLAADAAQDVTPAVASCTGVYDVKARLIGVVKGFADLLLAM
jgi:hypothetical protein